MATASRSPVLRKPSAAVASQAARSARGEATGCSGRVAASASSLTTRRGYRRRHTAGRPRRSPRLAQRRRPGARRRHLVPAQREAHDLRERRARDGAAAPAVAGVLDHDVDGELRVVGRGEAGERDRESAVVAAAVLADPLGRAGLAGDPVARYGAPPARCPSPGRRPAPSSARSVGRPGRSPPDVWWWCRCRLRGRRRWWPCPG